MADYDQIIKKLNTLETEKTNPRTTEIDRLSALEIARKINDEDKLVADVVEQQLGSISRASEIFADTLRKNGRIFYVGAGTSGRLGVLDAAECPPTFGTDPKQIIGVISGGHETLIRSREGIEDNAEAAVADLKERGLNRNDFVIGLTASKCTPYTLSGLTYAHIVGCRTAFVICNDVGSEETTLLGETIDIIIPLAVGPEVITGSTRMKSGTAQKMTLNIISTTAMILLGKTYGNLMVDLKATSDKLAARSRKMLIDLFQINVAEAGELLNGADGSVKIAIVMKKLKCDAKEAARKLNDVDGFIFRLGD